MTAEREAPVSKRICQRRVTMSFGAREQSVGHRRRTGAVVAFAVLAYQVLAGHLVISQEATSQAPAPARTKVATFPGVSPELAAFCAARPSLSVELALMIVHVKRDVSFNYKLYLLSTEHVFQTGQVVPRDDFRIHAFPVKLKTLADFWPRNVTLADAAQSSWANRRAKSSSATSSGATPNQPQAQLPGNSSFSMRDFLSPVPINPVHHRQRLARAAGGRPKRARSVQEAGDVLPGDEIRAPTSTPRNEMNRHIEFDRDDQLSVRRQTSYLQATVLPARAPLRRQSGEGSPSGPEAEAASQLTASDLVVPVGSFSSFKTNLTYLVRKDFLQTEPTIVRLQVDAAKFAVTQLELISNGTTGSGSVLNHEHEDFGFLSHRLLRDPNTRITAITQIYEDWITKNLYTVVYIQRRLEPIEDTATSGQTIDNSDQTVVNDRLVFRGTSTALLGADQLDYTVKAAAFITEKNGLHYYLEFLTTNKFYLCAIDWTKRPFRIVDSRRFPIKATRTQLDNEELLLCPPAVCYSSQPVDEVVAYGRLALPRRVERDALILSSSAPSISTLVELVKTAGLGPLGNASSVTATAAAAAAAAVVVADDRGSGGSAHSIATVHEDKAAEQDTNISLDNVIGAIQSGSGHLETQLHLRDWVWTLPRALSGPRQAALSASGDAKNGGSAAGHSLSMGTRFVWRYEAARRNDIKAIPDTYGFPLTGHEIDASFRIYNELYLISANRLIAINYKLPNETIITTHRLGDKFPGLSSALIEPVTGAFYDRYENHVYFFKGDRYIGYDYATKKALEDFQIPAPTDAQEPLVSSLPVVGILGRQHYVDGCYHDLSSDLVYIFSGMKFYTFKASEFKNGSFKPESRSLAPMRCINEHFLSGCSFDEAFLNPCHDEVIPGGGFKGDEPTTDDNRKANGKLIDSPVPDVVQQITGPEKQPEDFDADPFLDEKLGLRPFVTKAGLLNILARERMLSHGAMRNMDLGVDTEGSITSPLGGQTPEKIVIYLLMSMIVLTITIVIVMIVVLINWTKIRL